MSDTEKAKKVIERHAAKARPYEAPDGLGAERTVEREREINEIFAAIFKGKAGEQALNYLRNITLNRVMSPAATDSELRHREGQRSLVAIIERRVEDGRNRRPSVDGE